MGLRAARAAAWLAVAGLGLLASCKGPTPTLQGAVDDLGASLRQLLGTESLPGKYVQEIYAIHEDDRAWRFRVDADKPLDRTCEAVRGLATADYGSWREWAVVTRLLCAMTEEHPSSLVRAEALDTLAKMNQWTAKAEPPPARRATDEEAAAATDRILAARKKAQPDEETTADLADALRTIAAFRFDQSSTLPAKLDVRILARESRSRLVTTRKVLQALTGGAVEGYDADPRVRDALDRALVATSAAAIRLALVSSACGAKDEIVRTSAVRDIETARPDKAARILGVILASDDASSVRREAARALGSFPEAEAVPELIPALADDRTEVRAAAAASLSAVTGQALGDDRVAWSLWWKSRWAAAALSGEGPAAPAPEPGPR